MHVCVSCRVPMRVRIRINSKHSHSIRYRILHVVAAAHISSGLRCDEFVVRWSDLSDSEWWSSIAYKIKSEEKSKQKNGHGGCVATCESFDIVSAKRSVDWDHLSTIFHVSVCVVDAKGIRTARNSIYAYLIQSDNRCASATHTHASYPVDCVAFVDEFRPRKRQSSK